MGRLDRVLLELEAAEQIRQEFEQACKSEDKLRAMDAADRLMSVLATLQLPYIIKALKWFHNRKRRHVV